MPQGGLLQTDMWMAFHNNHFTVFQCLARQNGLNLLFIPRKKDVCENCSSVEKRLSHGLGQRTVAEVMLW